MPKRSKQTPKPGPPPPADLATLRRDIDRGRELAKEYLGMVTEMVLSSPEQQHAFSEVLALAGRWLGVRPWPDESPQW